MKFNKSQLTNILVFFGLLFTAARMIRETDNFYILALLSFICLWILNYKYLLKWYFTKSLFWFLPFGIWATISSLWSLEPFISFSRGLFYTFIMLTAVLIGFLYKTKLKELFRIFTLLNLFFILLSFISLISGIPSDAWTANHGMGFTSIFLHQNTLAAVLMFTLIGPVYFLLQTIVQHRIRHSDEGQNLKADADFHQHDIIEQTNLFTKTRTSHSEFHVERSRSIISESKPDAELKHFSTARQNESGNVKIKKSVIPARLLSLRRAELAEVSKYEPESIFSILLILSNLYFIYLSYSRAVMLALFIGGLIFIYLLGTIKFNLIFTVLMLILGTSIYYIFQYDLTSYLKKGANNYFDRREILWEPSYQAALNGGIIGLGYGVTDPTVESNYKKENKFGELKREKGNSILAIVEETGLIGLFLFFIPIIYAFTSFRNYNQSINNNQSIINQSINHQSINHQSINHQSINQSIINQSINQSSFPHLPIILVFSFLIDFFVHAQFEGWWTGISSIGLLIFLVLLSILFQTPNTKE